VLCIMFLVVKLVGYGCKLVSENVSAITKLSYEVFMIAALETKPPNLGCELACRLLPRIANALNYYDTSES